MMKKAFIKYVLKDQMKELSYPNHLLIVIAIFQIYIYEDRSLD